MNLQRQILFAGTLAGVLALPAAELVRVDFSREDATLPPRSTGYVRGGGDRPADRIAGAGKGCENRRWHTAADISCEFLQ